MGKFPFLLYYLPLLHLHVCVLVETTNRNVFNLGLLTVRYGTIIPKRSYQLFKRNSGLKTFEINQRAWRHKQPVQFYEYLLACVVLVIYNSRQLPETVIIMIHMSNSEADARIGHDC